MSSSPPLATKLRAAVTVDSLLPSTHSSARATAAAPFPFCSLALRVAAPLNAVIVNAKERDQCYQFKLSYVMKQLSRIVCIPIDSKYSMDHLAATAGKRGVSDSVPLTWSSLHGPQEIGLTIMQKMPR